MAPAMVAMVSVSRPKFAPYSTATLTSPPARQASAAAAGTVSRASQASGWCAEA
jgi:hypothetical protein